MGDVLVALVLLVNFPIVMCLVTEYIFPTLYLYFQYKSPPFWLLFGSIRRMATPLLPSRLFL